MGRTAMPVFVDSIDTIWQLPIFRFLLVFLARWVARKRFGTKTVATQSCKGAEPERGAWTASDMPIGTMDGCARASNFAETWGFHEATHLHWGSVSSVAELELRRSWKIHTINHNHEANCFSSADFARFRVDWHGGYTAVCCDGSSFRWHNVGYEQFGNVEFVGRQRRRGQHKGTGQRSCCRDRHNQRANGKY